MYRVAGSFAEGRFARGGETLEMQLIGPIWASARRNSGLIAALWARVGKVSGTRPKEKEQAMRKGELSKLVSVVGRIVLTFLFVFSQSTWAAQDQKTKAAANSTQKVAAQQTGEKQSSAATTAKAQSKQAQGEESESSVAEEKPSRDGSHEGIKVHGHWTIEVRNPDGTVATHREFENSLSPTGAAFLANLLNVCRLSSCSAFHNWAVILGGSPGPCAGNCVVPEGISSVQRMTATLQGATFVFAGSATAVSASSSITTVATSAFNFDGSFATLTSATLPTPVSVSPNQIIQFTVVISFS
jgi:hypothetical protein